MRFDINMALQAFRRIAHYGSFTRAAADMEVTASALSQMLRQLESHLGVRLLSRTTRHVGLTEAGQAFLVRITPALGEIDAAINDLREGKDNPAGILRITLSRTATDIVLLPKLAGFLRAYPDIKLEVDVQNGLNDIIADGFDAGIRFGEALQRDMLAVPVSAPVRFLVVGSPAYLAAHGTPRMPQDLHQHVCLRYRYVTSREVYRWEFEREGQAIKVAVDGPLISVNDNSINLRVALDGLGLAYVVETLVHEHIAAGRLVSVLEDWLPAAQALYLYYPNRAHMPPKLRVFIDHLRQGLV